MLHPASRWPNFVFHVLLITAMVAVPLRASTPHPALALAGGAEWVGERLWLSPAKGGGSAATALEEEATASDGFATTLSHLVWFIFKSGCETNKCQTTAWNASLCGVMLFGFTVGTITHASATFAA